MGLLEECYNPVDIRSLSVDSVDYNHCGKDKEMTNFQKIIKELTCNRRYKMKLVEDKNTCLQCYYPSYSALRNAESYACGYCRALGYMVGFASEDKIRSDKWSLTIWISK